MNVEICSAITIVCFVLTGIGLYQKHYRFSALSGLLLSVSGAFVGVIGLSEATAIQTVLSGTFMICVGAILAIRFNEMDKKEAGVQLQVS